jgi:hypothetical protein
MDGNQGCTFVRARSKHGALSEFIAAVARTEYVLVLDLGDERVEAFVTELQRRIRESRPPDMKEEGEEVEAPSTPSASLHLLWPQREPHDA